MTNNKAQAQSRLSSLLSHLSPFSSPTSPLRPGAIDNLEINGRRNGTHSWYNIHTLSPTFFLPRAAAIEPHAEAIVHTTANGKILRRTYEEFSHRAMGFAYYLKKHNLKRVGILCTNTPAFLESIFGIGAAGSINIAINYRLKADDISYIFDHADADSIVVDHEFVHLLDDYKKAHPTVSLIIDTDTDATEGELSGPFDSCVLEGLQYDKSTGSHGWAGLVAQCPDELAVNALAYTSGTTARPKGVEYTHRGCYLGAIGNVIESGLNYHDGQRCRYLWTLPMFHAMGWTFPWAITAARGTHYCLRKIDYPEIWRLLKDEGITHYCGAPTVNTLLCNDKNAERLQQKVRVTVAASPPTAHLFEVMTGLNLHPVHVYGLTETYGPITKGYILPEWNEFPNVKDKYAKMARQGHGFVMSLPSRVIKTEHAEEDPEMIEDVKKDGKEIGEIVFEGNICARGYYKDEKATRKLFAGGVCHSGDLAVWHPDGAIQILDRAKDIIISGTYCEVLWRLLEWCADIQRWREHFVCCSRIDACDTPGYSRMWCSGCL
jgi:acyl-CoA synthetase (AMP-forming)/AMP-acid ligase II